MCKLSITTIAVVILYGILLVHADDSEDSSEEEALPPTGLNCPNTPRYCRANPPPNRVVCGTNGVTYLSWCWLRQDACARGGSWKVAYRGQCRPPPPPPRPRATTKAPTTTKPPTTTRPTTARQTIPPASTPAVLPPQQTTPPPPPPGPTSMQMTTRTRITCPPTCGLVFDPVCTTVGTYQSACAFNAVKCRGIIPPEEAILFRGECPTTPVPVGP